MLLTIAKLNPRPRHCLWLLLLVIVIISKTDLTSAHAPPRKMYYGHRVSQEKISAPQVLVGPNRNQIPTCGQLRYIWKSAYKDLYGRSAGYELENDLMNEIPVILDNPYYTTVLWHQQNQRVPYGKIISRPAPSTSPAHNLNYNEEAQEPIQTSRNSHSNTNIPGVFSKTPVPKNKIGIVYGQVRLKPNDTPRQGDAEDRSSHHSSNHNGVFGKFAENSVYDSNKDESSSSEDVSTVNKPNGAKQQRTGSFSTAEEFFRSGFWHNKPVIPSVSFQN